jgi:hypothetical protein
MPENGIRSTYSQSPFQIFMYDDAGVISTGSGFFYEYGEESFLITNWHNFSGRHFLTRAPISDSSRFPTYIKVKLSTYIDGHRFTTVAQRVDIYKDYEPCWYQHPSLGQKCDVVALPLNRPKNCPEFMHNAANCISKIKIPVKPGCTAFIIGFPHSLSVGFGLPLWKSGYIASEPHYDIELGGSLSEIAGTQGGIQLPAFFIDSLTRSGMSGSPVFAAYTGNWDSSDPYKELNTDDPDFWNRDDVLLGENRMQFIGCYSGRVGKEEEGAALGLCWREDVIQEICKSRKIGEHPQIMPSNS